MKICALNKILKTPEAKNEGGIEIQCSDYAMGDRES